MKNRIVQLKKYGLFVLSVIGFILMVSFAENEHDKMVCNALKIRIFSQDEYEFINKQKIVKYLFPESDSITIEGQNINNVKLSDLEKKLEKDAYIKNVEVYSNPLGEIFVDVTQRKPLVRIIKGSGKDYYIDEYGIKFPISAFNPARVPVASGFILEKYEKTDSIYTKSAKRVYGFAKFISTDEFWKAMVDQIEVESNGDLCFYNILSKHKVVVGNIENLEERMMDLKIFYKKYLSLKGMDTYKMITIKYKGQIIGEK